MSIPDAKGSKVKNAAGRLIVTLTLALLAGAFALIVGFRGAHPVETDVGGVLIGLGIVLELGVIAFCIGRARAAARRPTRSGPSAHPGRPPQLTTMNVCGTCGWRGAPTRTALCPRCFRPVVAGADPRR